MSGTVSCRRLSASSIEMGAAEVGCGEAEAMHERLVAYVHALATAHEPRTGVWVEHSYARARGAPDAAASGLDVRVILAGPASVGDGDALDVEALDAPPPEPPDADPSALEEDAEVDTPAAADDWEARVEALAPSAAHARLAEAAFTILRRLRLARLAGRQCMRREDVRAAARRLRLALARGWAAPGAAQQRPPAWLHAALHAYLPPELRPLYEDVVGELRRATPRLAERLMPGRTPLAPEPCDGDAPDPGHGPVLAWLRTGRERLEARWERRLRLVLPTRPVEVAAVAEATPPEAWCAAIAGAARLAIAELAAAVGERELIVGGVGAGAAVCAAAVSGTGAARVHGALLLAPALVTAEGSRDAPDDPLGEVRVPVLLVVGSAAANSWRGAARAIAAAPCPAPRRLVEVSGADHLLRVGRATRRRLALSQRALDAAVAEECARWASDAAEGALRDADWPRHQTTAAGRPSERTSGAGAGAESSQAEEGAHPPSRAIHIVEGRVVSRVSGATPLALVPPPPRRPEATPPVALAAADIMQLPIVFADDERALAEGTRRARSDPDDELTVTSGAGEAHVDSPPRRVKYARVIVAKRGGGGGAAPVVLRRGGRPPH